MQIPNNNLFCVYGVGAIIEHIIEEERFVLIQNRIRQGKQSGLIEVPCGKVKAMEGAYDVIKQRVKEETGLRITKIDGMEESRTMKKNIQNCQPFYSCQSIERDFPVAINFFVCSAEGIPKKHTKAAENIRWIAIDELSRMLMDEEEKFFPVVVGALKEYVKGIEERKRKDMEFMSKFKPNENKIKEFENWIVVIREKQVTLGASVILLKRQISSLSEMTEAEAKEFPKVIKWYEEKCKKCYGAEKFNYVVAMMKDNFVHYHAFPRYSFVINKYEKKWEDQDWPKVVNFRNVDIEKEILERIIKDMQD